MQATRKKATQRCKVPATRRVCLPMRRAGWQLPSPRPPASRTRQARLSPTRAPYGVKRSTSLRYDIPSVRSNVPPLGAGNIVVRLTEPPPFASGIAALVVAAPIAASTCVAHTTSPAMRRCALPKKQPKKARSSAVEKNVTAVLTAAFAKSPVSVPTSIAPPCHSTRHAWGGGRQHGRQGRRCGGRRPPV